jgi:hypothetical protein
MNLHRLSPRTPRGLFAIVTAALLAACGGDSSTTPAPPGPGPGPDDTTVASVVVTPSTATLVAGDTLSLSAVARTAGGGTVAGATITWAASDTTPWVRSARVRQGERSRT